MEVQKLDTNSIKIKGKNASIVIDPSTKVDAEIVLVTLPEETLALDKVNGVRLIITGPGEYEAGGISISGKATKDSVVYTITESTKILFAKSTSINAISDDISYDAVVVHVVGPFSDDTLGPVDTKSVVLYGDLAEANIKSTTTEKASKVSLKKTSEIQGKTFLLE